MPVYEYKCNSCNKRHERRQGISEPRTSFITCECGGVARRMFSVPQVVIYKGYHEALNFYSSPEGEADYA